MYDVMDRSNTLKQYPMLKKNVIRAFLITVFLCCCSYGFFLNIGGWLTTSDVPAQVDAVICLDGSSDRINKAVLLLQKGFAEKNSSLQFLMKCQRKFH